MSFKPKAKRVVHRLRMAALAAALFAAFLPLAARAKNLPADALPALEQFVEQVANGEADTLRGAYVPLMFALPVVQQPQGEKDYISPMSAALTEFDMARKAGGVGLLAHNYLAGRHFFLIRVGDPIFLVYGNRRVETFVVEDVRKYEEMYDGTYKDLETLERYGIGELFQKMYGGPRHVTLQTCIEKDGDLNWGRLFIIAQPQEDSSAAERALVPPPPPPPPPVFSKQILGWPLAPKAEQNLKPAYRLNARVPK